MASKELVSDYSRLRTYYMSVAKKYQKEPVNLPQCQDLPDSTDYLYPDEVEALEVCDNDPDLDIQTGYRVYAQEGLNFKLDYQAGLDTYFKAGNLKYFSANKFGNYFYIPSWLPTRCMLHNMCLIFQSCKKLILPKHKKQRISSILSLITPPIT